MPMGDWRAMCGMPESLAKRDPSPDGVDRLQLARCAPVFSPCPPDRLQVFGRLQYPFRLLAGVESQLGDEAAGIGQFALPSLASAGDTTQG
jgi:hypothetical protein